VAGCWPERERPGGAPTTGTPTAYWTDFPTQGVVTRVVYQGTGNHIWDLAGVPVMPTVMTETPIDILTDSAGLTGNINPEGWQTTYRFEYGQTTDYGSFIPVPDANIGSGSTPVEVSQLIQPLRPRTVYHCRLVASTVNGAVYGTDVTL
jgi:hypothetical protein